MREIWIKPSKLERDDLEVERVFCIKDTKNKCFVLGIVYLMYKEDDKIHVVSISTTENEHYVNVLTEDEFKNHFERV